MLIFNSRAYRQLLVVLVVTLVTFLLQACGGKEASQTQAVPAGSSAESGVTNSRSSGGPIRITIGYQSTTAQTWGALIIKNKKLYEKYLKELYPDQSFDIQWFDAAAGSILNNNMIGGKVQISFLGDMPILLNGEMGITQPNYHSVFLAFDGKGALGRNQAIVVPKNSDIRRIEDLAGKTVSTPIGSSAHRMLLETLKRHNLIDKVNIVDQSVTVGMQSIEQNKIAAHSTWEPYPSLILQRGIGEILQSGEATQIDYLAGVVANLDWAKQNRSYVVAFLKALLEAHQFAKNHPEEAAAIFAEESKVPKEVTEKLVHQIRFDAAIYDKDLKTLEGDMQFLSSLGKLEKPLDLKVFVDDSYLRDAVKSLGKPYLSDQELKGDWVQGKEY